jgi:hypothetical protein
MIILDLKRFVLAELPGNADMLVEYHMLEGVKDMCRETFVYEETISTVSVIDQAIYPLVSTITNTKFISLIDGKYKDDPVPIIDVDFLRACDQRWDIRKGTPTNLIYQGGNTAQFNRIPDVAGDAIKFRIAILPTKIISELPEVIENHHIEAVKNYVKWKVWGSAPFNDTRKADQFERKYINERDKLKGKVITDFSSSYSLQFSVFDGFG